jgi:membrane protein
VGAVFTVLAAYAWPAELRRFYEAGWGLPTLGWRQLWRPLVWLGSLLVVVAAVAVVGSIAGGVVGTTVTAACLAAFSVVTSVYLSRAIVWNADRYGPIGVVFVLMSWLTWFSTLLLGGAVVGHIVHLRRTGSSG